jgi:N-acetylglucosamine-6-phosphate deacetylase
LPDGAVFSLAGRDCVVMDGTCWLADRSALAGSAARMIDLIRVMVERVGVPLHDAIGMAAANPARALGQNSAGVIAVDAAADLVVLSPTLEVLQTFSAGRRAG